ncbi:cytochrome c [Paraglaciecola aquimarina]|uniref:Cytochrome c n=1 Tax=Paraglaciecola aquimarina TaxID=1235557 RepID=A0ABU3SSX3_9ALTE|nr:cytochrome c [Paraglaciecola aquimarina]MDU0353067.1 cytochrome c [Paraglaciecola aquimarina]
MKKMTIVVLSSVLFFSAFTAGAAPAKSEKQANQAVEFRQAILKLVKSNVGALGAMNKGAIPFDAETLKTNGMRLEQLSLMLEDYFATDTSGFDTDTEALDKIWKNQADFNSKANDLTKAAAKLQAVAASGNEGQYKSAIGDIFKTCKGCHDSYKKD